MEAYREPRLQTVYDVRYVLNDKFAGPDRMAAADCLYWCLLLGGKTK